MNDIKENYVKEILKNIDFKGGKWTLESLKNKLKEGLGEFPAVDVKYKKDVSVNETTGDAIEIHEVDRIAIVFTGTDDSFKKVEIII